MEKKYPIGGYAPGNYQCKCTICGGGFIGDKRAAQCEPCALADKAKFDALSPTEQEELVKRNAKIAREFFAHAGVGELELLPMPEPVGQFILDQPGLKPMVTSNGYYWHYQDVITLMKEYAAKATPKGIGWVKAETKPEHNVGVLVFIPGEDNHITSGMWDISNEWVLLDEYRTPEEEVTHWMPMPGLPEGIESNDLPDDIVKIIKKIAREELRLDESQPQPPQLAKQLLDFIRDLATNWDCDEDGHKNNTGCRKCSASELLYDLTRKE